jgi:hypothetical protein
MDIQPRRLTDQPFAQTLRIRMHSLVADAGAAAGGSDAGISLVVHAKCMNELWNPETF